MAIAPSQTPEIYATGIQIPLTTEAKRMAHHFADQCPFAEKSTQIRRNTLAVCAVEAYLQLMEIPSVIAQSDSWNPLIQMMADVADLAIPGVGSLSCRPVLDGEPTCLVPPEDWENRIGYVAVKLDEAASRATLLGFTTTVNATEQVPIEQFEPLEALIDEIHQLGVESSPAADTMGTNSLLSQRFSRSQSTLTRLGQWIEGVASAGWQATDELINPPEMGFAFRTANLATPETRSETTTDVSRAKLIDLGIQLGQSVQVALVVHMVDVGADAGTEAGEGASTARSNIILQVRPFGNSPYLPEDLTLTVLDDEGASFMSTTSRAIDNYIQLRLSGESGEQFSIQISMGSATFEEAFVI
ncbi:MAG: DUF1822 family protein [Cyanobacteria bacterium J06634_6]